MKLYLVIFLHVFITSFTVSETTLQYKTITVADKVWMAENFKENISSGECYENNLSNCMNMGRLYSYDAAVKNAPKGWHLPSKAEWDILLYEIRKAGKNPYDVLVFGDFDAKLAGFKDSYGDYTKINYQVRFWSATEWGNENDKAWYMYLNKSREMADVDTDEKKCLFSVRYVKD